MGPNKENSQQQSGCSWGSDSIDMIAQNCIIMIIKGKAKEAEASLTMNRCRPNIRRIAEYRHVVPALRVLRPRERRNK
jgi:hypothetical protein